MKKITLILCMIILASCYSHKNKSDAYGNFEADEIIISSEIPGKLIRFGLEEGDIIATEKEIGLIDTTDYQLKKNQLIAQRNSISTKSGNINAQIDVQQQSKNNLMIEKTRIENLLKDGAATKKQWDDINGNIHVIDKQIMSIRTQHISVSEEINVINKQIDQIDESIRKCHIYSLVSGTVLNTYVNQGELVTQGKAMFKIADLSNVYLRAYISESQLSSITLGQQVSILIDKGKDDMISYKGLITWISSTAEFTPKIIQTRDERVNLVYAIKIKVKNDGLIKIGMPGEVIFK